MTINQAIAQELANQTKRQAQTKEETISDPQNQTQNVEVPLTPIQKKIQEISNKYGEGITNSAIEYVNTFSRGKVYYNTYTGSQRVDYHKAINELRSIPEIDTAVSQGNLARQEAKRLGFGSDVQEYQQAQQWGEHISDKPKTITQTPIQPTQQNKQVQIERQQGMSTRQTLTPSAETLKGTSQEREQQIKDYRMNLILKPNIPKEFQLKEEIKPSSIEQPSTFERLQTQIQKKTGIYVPSPKEVYQQVFRSGEPEYNQVRQININPIKEGSVVGDIGRTFTLTAPKYGAELGGEVLSTLRSKLPTKQYTTESRIVPQRVTTGGEYKTQPFTYDIFPESEARFTGQLIGGGATLLAGQTLFSPIGMLRLSTASATRPRTSIQERIESGLIGISFIPSSLNQVKTTFPKLFKRLEVTETITKRAGQEQQAVKSIPFLRVTSPERKSIYYNIVSTAQPESFGREVQVRLRSPIKDLFFRNEPLPRKEAIELLKDNGIGEKEIQRLLRTTKPKIQQHTFLGIGETRTVSGKEPVELITGKTFITPVKELRPSTINYNPLNLPRVKTEVGTRSFQPYGNIPKTAGSQIGETELADIYKSSQDVTKVLYTKDLAPYQKVSQFGKTSNLYESTSAIKKVESLKLGNLRVEPTEQMEFFKEISVTRELLESGRLSKPELSSSSLIILQGEPKLSVNMPQPIRVEKILEKAPKMTKEQADKLIIKNIKDIKSTLKDIYGKPTKPQLAYETSQKQAGEILSQVPKPPKSQAIKPVLGNINIPQAKPIGETASVFTGTGLYERFSPSENVFISSKETTKSESIGDNLFVGNIPTGNTMDLATSSTRANVDLGTMSSNRIDVNSLQGLDLGMNEKLDLNAGQKGQEKLGEILKTEPTEKVQERQTEKIGEKLQQKQAQKITEKISDILKQPNKPINDEPRIPIKSIIEPPDITNSKKKLKRIASAIQDIEVFTRTKGEDILIGKASNKREAGQLLTKNLKSTLSASGFAKQGNRKLSLSELGIFGSEFKSSKKDMFRVTQQRGFRLGTKPEVNKIQFLKKSGGYKL